MYCVLWNNSIEEVNIIDYVTVRDFRASPKAVWEKLGNNGTPVLKNNGKPAARETKA
jgi:hypothetical protein